ncbi:hypothetical protein MGG_17572 [Pyricularia oryzae 70-15]|uniref:Uncharacterized protein n=1 Tax=Pyricularia oryzae (strain 70-15 / ATCC MYA-4617 / FGSC 8958) TaxID=242507 RepID=G4NFP7_PYRO7|nr:uncharacterized protein MGG_17572 [Pyricularia oryzae 70-15]EHA46854.1 hypothetical protein MGG_17572 [Pyricularia oryzae 70-15]KAI7921678.1 hypothetical protein M0657_005993 [Pyricularia oryzae]KAI7926205.1 hypothetical protein M9X92_002950 [Pyricularia oryzae]
MAKSGHEAIRPCGCTASPGWFSPAQLQPFPCPDLSFHPFSYRRAFLSCTIVSLLTTRKEITKPLASLLPPAPPFPTTLLSSKQQFVGSCRCVHVAGAHPSSAHVLHLENMPHIL